MHINMPAARALLYHSLNIYAFLSFFFCFTSSLGKKRNTQFNAYKLITAEWVLESCIMAQESGIKQLMENQYWARGGSGGVCRDEAGVENHHPLGFGDFAEITRACAEGWIFNAPTSIFKRLLMRNARTANNVFPSQQLQLENSNEPVQSIGHTMNIYTQPTREAKLNYFGAQKFIYSGDTAQLLIGFIAWPGWISSSLSPSSASINVSKLLPTRLTRKFGWRRTKKEREMAGERLMVFLCPETFC
jgi:hypothetical protein